MTNNDGVTTVCYGMRRNWNSRNDAIIYFQRALNMSFDSRDEKKRYKRICKALKENKAFCTDDIND